MAFQPQVFQFGFATAATNVSVTSSIELDGSYLYTFLNVPTMTAGYSAASTPIFLQGSPDNTSFFRITNAELTNNTLVAGINDYTVASSVSQRLIPLPGPIPRFLRLEISGTVTNPTAIIGNPFKLICISNQ